jgi:hypothetical protein
LGVSPKPPVRLRRTPLHSPIALHVILSEAKNLGTPRCTQGDIGGYPQILGGRSLLQILFNILSLEIRICLGDMGVSPVTILIAEKVVYSTEMM